MIPATVLENTILLLIALFLIVGLCSGFIGGLLGIGGGVIIVPVLYLLFSRTGLYPNDMVLLVAVATSLACIVFTSASAAYSQIKGQRVHWPVVRQLLPFVLLGSLFAGYVAPQLPSQALKLGFALFISIVSMIMFFDWKPAPHRQWRPGVRRFPLAWGRVSCPAWQVSPVAT